MHPDRAIHQSLWTVAVLATVATSGCRHRSEPAIPLTGWLPAATSNESLAAARDTSRLPVASAGAVLADPNQYQDHAMRVLGTVGRVEIRQLPKDMAALILLIHDPVILPEAPGQPQVAAIAVPEKLALGAAIAPLPADLIAAAGRIDRLSIDRNRLESHYFQLKSTGSRVRALSSYLAGNGASDMAAGTDQLAIGIQSFADGYRAVAAISPPPVATGIHLEGVTPEPILAVAPSEFDRQLDAAAAALQQTADQLISRRDDLVHGRLIVTTDGLVPDAGLVLVSAGHTYDAAAWGSEGRGDANTAALNRQLSLACIAFGKGLNGVAEGSHSLALAVANRPLGTVPASIAAAPSPAPPIMLKCAIVGWNRALLADAAKRLEALGSEVPVQIHGRVVRGNFREEVDQTWIAMESVSVDGLAIDLTYDDSTQTTRSLADLYRWVGETVE